MDDDLEGIDVGDLPEVLERIASEQADADALADDDLPIREEYDGYCQHSSANINSGMRSLTCRECGADLDAFDWLLRLSRHTSRYVSARKDAEQRAAAARDRLNEILRLERNAKARLQRLKRKETP